MSLVLVRKDAEQFYVDSSQARVWEDAGYTIFQPMLYELSPTEVQEVSKGMSVQPTSVDSLEYDISVSAPAGRPRDDGKPRSFDEVPMKAIDSSNGGI